MRLLEVRAVLRVPEDAAATAQLTGLVHAGLSILCAGIRNRQRDSALLSVTVTPAFGREPCSLVARVKLSFRTANLLRGAAAALRRPRGRRTGV